MRITDRRERHAPTTHPDAPGHSHAAVRKDIRGGTRMDADHRQARTSRPDGTPEAPGHSQAAHMDS
jgi:hypothetical protein